MLCILKKVSTIQFFINKVGFTYFLSTLEKKCFHETFENQFWMSYFYYIINFNRSLYTLPNYGSNYLSDFVYIRLSTKKESTDLD